MSQIKLRDAYGRNPFGEGCLLARRLVERGVPFIEVGLTQVPGSQSFGWDTHVNNFAAVRNLSNVLDPGWATLISDLRDRGLLESTLIVWMGEFGRTPRINGNNGSRPLPSRLVRRTVRWWSEGWPCRRQDKCRWNGS